MNLWAVQIKRKSHSKEVLSAKIVDVDTMDVTEMGSDMLIPVLKTRRFIINNLSLDANGKLILVNYLKNGYVKNSSIQFHRQRTGDYLTESFVIALGGCDGVYDVVFDVPDKIRGAYRMFGDILDIDTEICTRTGYDWENYNVFNAVVNNDDEMWTRDSNGNEYKIQFKEYKQIADIRNAIQAEYCTMTYVKGMLAIVRVKFNSKNVDIPEGIEMFGYSYGGAYMISLPESLKKLNARAFKQDDDILQVCINSPIEEIPAQLCMGTGLQYLDYTPKNILNKVCTGAFYECIDMKQSLILSVKEIEKFAFTYSGIRRISLPFCSKIGKKAFYSCGNLESARIQDVTIVEEKAFANCTKLSDVKMDSVKYICSGAFADCRRLKQVNVPKEAVIEDGAFHKKTVINRI